MLRRNTGFKAAIFHFFMCYSNRFFGTLYTFVAKSLAKYSNPAAVSKTLRVCLENNS
jgi:hypothetical protein